MAFSRHTPFEAFQRLAPRERTLLIAVVGTAFAIANLLAITSVANAFRNLRHQGADAALDLKVQNLFAAEQPTWTKRTQWLHATQPVLASRDRAGAALLEQVQAMARGSQVIVSNPQIRPPAPTSSDGRVQTTEFQPVTVEVETQSDWGSLVKFMTLVQRPDQFLVCDLATLRSDPADPARMKGQFRISKWYAPGGRPK